MEFGLTSTLVDVGGSGLDSPGWEIGLPGLAGTEALPYDDINEFVWYDDDLDDLLTVGENLGLLVC